MMLQRNKLAIKILLLNTIIFMILSTITVLPVTADNNKTVLLLNSYHNGLTWTDQETEGIIHELDGKFPQSTVKVEYLDWKDYPDNENLELSYNQLKYKYSNTKLDVLIATDDIALDFALKNRAELFSGAPIVFCGVNKEGVNKLAKGIPNITGVIEEVDPMETVKGALEIVPNMKRIYILYDNTESGISTGRLSEEAVRKSSPGTEIVTLNDRNFEEIIKEAGKAPKDSAILITSYYEDAEGKKIGLEYFTRMVSENSNVPVFHLYDFAMGYGALGGNLLSGRLQGEGAGKLAVRILNGEAAADIPIQIYPSTKNIYDYEQLQRFQIPVSKLPQNSTIINKPFSFFEAYKNLVILVSAAFIILTAFIAVLLVYITRANSMKKMLFEKNEELTQLYEELTASDEELQQQLDELSATQESLLVSEERYMLASQAANDAIWDLDLRSNNEYLTDRWYEISGYTADEYEQIKPWYNLIHPDDFAAAYQEILNSKKEKVDHCQCQVRIKTKDGEYRWVLARAKLVFDQTGQVSRIAVAQTDITELKEYELKLHKLAFYDKLTGLQNRESLSNQLASLIEKDANKRLSLFFIDVDNFKYINDTMGHHFGDLLIANLAEKLRSLASENTGVYRLGGDEFVVLLEEYEDLKEVERLANYIVNVAREPFITEDITLNTTVSVGISIFPDYVSSKHELMRSADIAMYKAKGGGKDKYVYYDRTMEEAVIERMEIEKNLRSAMHNNEFTLYFQPQVDVLNMEIIGFEALLRWYSPELGFIPPSKFIKVAEDTQLIVPLGIWVLESACRFLKELQILGYADYTMSVNISVVQVMKDDFVDNVIEILQSLEIEPEYLELEITETVLAESFDTICQKLDLLRKRGVKVALDDFGRGYSSLNYLNQLPITTLKIDKVFVDNIETEKSSKTLMELISMVGREMNLNVIAEGVETKEQLNYLKKINCNNVQGYLFFRPLPKEQILKIINDKVILPE